jgi:hypothetical protein
MPAAIVAGDTAVAECSALLRDDFPSFCRVHFPRAQPARPVRGELALRANRREAGRGARRPNLPGDRQRAAAPN